MDTYQKIKEACAVKKISISELERKICVSSNSLSKWKTVSPTVDSLLKVADYFNLPLDYFVGRTVEPPPLTNISNKNGIVANGAVSNNGNNSNNFSPNGDKFNNLTEIEKTLLEVAEGLTMLQKIDIINYAQKLKNA